jgi:hypothetical protein
MTPPYIEIYKMATGVLKTAGCVMGDCKMKTSVLP